MKRLDIRWIEHYPELCDFLILGVPDVYPIFDSSNISAQRSQQLVGGVLTKNPRLTSLTTILRVRSNTQCLKAPKVPALSLCKFRGLFWDDKPPRLIQGQQPCPSVMAVS